MIIHSWRLLTLELWVIPSPSELQLKYDPYNIKATWFWEVEISMKKQRFCVCLFLTQLIIKHLLQADIYISSYKSLLTTKINGRSKINNHVAICKWGLRVYWKVFSITAKSRTNHIAEKMQEDCGGVRMGWF